MVVYWKVENIFTVHEKPKINKNCSKRTINSNNVLDLATPKWPKYVTLLRNQNQNKTKTDSLSASKPIYRLIPLLQGIPTGEKTN